MSNSLGAGNSLAFPQGDIYVSRQISRSFYSYQMEGTARLSRKKVILDFDVEFTLVTSERKR